jgi:outer membrane protein
LRYAEVGAGAPTFVLLELCDERSGFFNTFIFGKGHNLQKNLMKNISTLISVVALVMVGILYYLYFSHSQKTVQAQMMPQNEKEASNFSVAYFDLDSLEANYSYFKELLTQVKSKENAMNLELSGMEKTYQKKISEWQQKGNAMTQAEGEQAQREYATMQQNYQLRKQALQEELFRHNEDLKADIRKKIEDFLAEFNKQKKYSYIFAYESSSPFMYCKDTAFNITKELVDGLNASYNKKKK